MYSGSKSVIKGFTNLFSKSLAYLFFLSVLVTFLLAVIQRTDKPPQGKGLISACSLGVYSRKDMATRSLRLRSHDLCSQAAGSISSQGPWPMGWFRNVLPAVTSVNPG